MKKKILIVCADYYKDITKDLKTETLKALRKNQFTQKFIINTKTVPGVFEIPVVISKNNNKYDGFIALGCVIKGQTPHFDYISNATINALMNLSIQFKKPMGNAILTCLNQNQAKVRSKGSKNKGREAAEAVIKVLKND